MPDRPASLSRDIHPAPLRVGVSHKQIHRYAKMKNVLRTQFARFGPIEGISLDGPDADALMEDWIETILNPVAVETSGIHLDEQRADQHRDLLYIFSHSVERGLWPGRVK